MIKKYKHMRENFVDDYFADVLNVEDDDIWNDDTYDGEDSDIHKTNIADSDDDLPDDFFDIDDDFDEDDFIDVEEPEYWENSKEIDPNDYDLKNNSSAASNWSKLASEEDLDDDTFTPDEHLEDYTNAIEKSLDPAHSDSFRKIMNLDGMEESKKEVKKNRLKEDSAFICTNKPKDEKRDLPEWVYQRFGKIYESYNK